MANFCQQVVTRWFFCIIRDSASYIRKLHVLCLVQMLIMFHDCTNSFRKLIKKVPPSVTERKYGFKVFRNVQVFIVRKVYVFSSYSLSVGSQRMPHKVWSPWIKHFQLKQSVDLFPSMFLMRSSFFGFKTWLMEAVNRRWWLATAPFSSVEALRGFSENTRQVIVKIAPGEWWEQEMKKHPRMLSFLLSSASLCC